MDRRPLSLATFSAVMLIGCLPTDGSASSSGSASSTGGPAVDGGDGGVSQATQACLDTADAYSAAAQRCGGDYNAEHTAFIRDLANGDCSSVSIRNEAELRNGCFPSLAVIDCDSLMNMRVDPTCAEQIIRSK